MGALHTLMRIALGARLPIVEGTMRVTGIRGSVSIRRDEHGVVYVEASEDDDAFFGLGFAQAQDRAFQLELLTRVARGTLAEITGREMLPVDRLSRRIGFARIGRAQLEVLEPAVRAQLAAFTRGVNAGLKQGGPKPHELVLLGRAPSTFEAGDILAIIQFFAFALSSNWDAELARLRVLRSDGLEALRALEAADAARLEDDRGASRLLADADVLGAAERLGEAVRAVSQVVGLGGGSNNWALAPSRTATGRPILACDPHLSPSLPNHWYLVNVRTPRWAMSGACLISQPVVSFGHNDRVAWGLTAGHVDNTDLFVERIGPDGSSVLVGDRHRACEVRDEVIRVKGAPDVHERVLITRHGPIVSPAIGGESMALSLRGTWMAKRPIGGYPIFRARSVEEARALFRSYPATSENRLFADVDGHIGFQVVGDAPIRKKGHGLLPMPGWDPEVGWEDAIHPFESMPAATDPEIGFLATANQKPQYADRAPYLGADWLDGSRYRRIVEQLETRHDWDVASSQALQLDRTTLLWRSLRDPLLAALRDDASATIFEIELASRLLERWDGVASASSAAATIFELTFAELMKRAVTSRAPVSWRAALGEGTNVVLPHGMMLLRRIEHMVSLLRDQPSGWFAAGWTSEIRSVVRDVVRNLVATRGADPKRWAWGDVRPLFLKHPLGSKPPLDEVFDRGPIACGGDAATLPQASVDFLNPLGNPVGVANMRLVIDVGAWERSRWSLAGGQSGNPMSKHYDDLLPIWERGDGVPIHWTPASIEGATRSMLRLMPA